MANNIRIKYVYEQLRPQLNKEFVFHNYRLKSSLSVVK